MDKQEFESLKEQLTDHHVNGVGNGYTASPLYLVQVKRTNWGYEQEYAEHHAIYYDDCYWYSAEDFYNDHDLDDEEEMDYFLKDALAYAREEFKEKYRSWDLNDLWHFLESYFPYHEYTYYHGNDYWETVNWFLTKEAAENFLASRGVKNLTHGVSEDGCSRIYIESLYRSYEIKDLLNSIINGDIVWREE